MPTAHSSLSGLFGRGAELSPAYQALDDARAGRPRIVLIQGDAGIGKTALASVVVQRAAEAGFERLTGRAHQNLTAPYLVVAQALDPVLAGPSGLNPELVEDVRRFLQGHATAGETAGSPEAPSLDVRGLVSLARLLRLRSEQHPLALWFEDAHWMSDADIAVLTHLAFAALAASHERWPMLLILTIRDAEAPTSLARLTRQLSRESDCTLIQLEALDELALHELALSALGYHPRPALVAALAEFSGGNPLLARELLARHRRAGRGPNDRIELDASSVDLGALLTERFLSLDRAGRSVAATTALVGSEVEVRLVEEVLGAEPGALDGAFDRAVQAGVLERERAKVRFVHPLLLQVAYLSTRHEERASTHAAIARTLLADAQQAGSDDEVAIAFHAVRAGPDGVALPDGLLRHAGDRAYGMSAWADAVRYYRAALDQSPERDLDLQHLVARAEYRNHDVPSALRDLEQVATLAEARADWPRACRALTEYLRAQIAHRRGPEASPLDTARLEHAVEQLAPDEHDLRALATELLSEVELFVRRDVPAALSYGRQALEAGDRAGSPALRMMSRFALGLAHWDALEVEEAQRWLESAQDEVEEAPDLWLRGWAPVRLALLHNTAGRLDAAEHAALDARRIYTESHDWSEHSLAYTSLALTALARGDLALAERHALVALSMVERSEYGWTAGIVYPALACTRALRGDWREARDALVAWRRSEGRPWDQWALIDLLREGPAHAGLALAGHHAQATTSTSPDLFSTAWMSAVTELGVLAEDRGVVVAQIEGLLAASDRRFVMPLGWSAFIPTLLARAHAVLGNEQAAGDAFEGALEQAVDSGLRLEEARTRMWFGAYLVRKEAQPSSRGVALLQDAAQAFAEMRAQPLEALARGALLGIAPRAAAPAGPGRPSFPGGLSAREVDVLRAIARGLTNDGIAEQLVISPATARRHVANIYLKLDIPNRAAAAAYCIEHGLLEDAGAAARA